MNDLLATLPRPAASSKGDDTIERIKVGDRATIFRTPASPCWYMQFNLEGKQYRSSLKTQSKKRALDLAKKKDAQLVLGQAEPPSAKAVTVVDAKERYLQTLMGRGRSLKTTEAYGSRLGVFVGFCEQRGIKYLHRVTADHLEDYQRQLQEKGFVPSGPRKCMRGPGFKKSANKPGTVRDKLKIVRQLINWARKRNLLKLDPSAGYDLPPAVKQQGYCWTPEELTIILRHAPEHMHEIFDFLRLTGLRGDEFCWLLKDDLVADPPHIKIRAKVCPLTEQRWKPKHGNERIVPLCAKALEIAQRAAAASPGPWLFFAPDTQGKQKGRWRIGRVWKALKATMKIAGVVRGTTHTFRHAFCSFLANQGVSPYRIMKVMGHDGLEIVLLYCHATEAELIEAIVAVPFEKMMAEAGKGGEQK